MTSQQLFAEAIHDAAKQHSLHGWTQLVGSIDLAAFQAMSTDDRRATWATATSSDKLGLVLQILRAKSLDFDSDVILSRLWALEMKFGSDQPIPPTAEILVVVKERHKTAVDHGDFPGARRLDRVRFNLLSGARMHWSLGDLLIQSVNNPGAVYSTNRRGCTCKNGKSKKSECWHAQELHDLLLGMQADRADIADELEPAAERSRSAYAHDPCLRCGASGVRPDDLCYCAAPPTYAVIAAECPSAAPAYAVITAERHGTARLDERALGERLTQARRALLLRESTCAVPAGVAIVGLVLRNLHLNAPVALADLRGRLAGDATPFTGRTTRTLDAYQLTALVDGRNAALVAALALVGA